MCESPNPPPPKGAQSTGHHLYVFSPSLHLLIARSSRHTYAMHCTGDMVCHAPCQHIIQVTGVPLGGLQAHAMCTHGLGLCVYMYTWLMCRSVIFQISSFKLSPWNNATQRHSRHTIMALSTGIGPA